MYNTLRKGLIMSDQHVSVPAVSKQQHITEGAIMSGQYVPVPVDSKPFNDKKGKIMPILQRISDRIRLFVSQSDNDMFMDGDHPVHITNEIFNQFVLCSLSWPVDSVNELVGHVSLCYPNKFIRTESKDESDMVQLIVLNPETFYDAFVIKNGGLTEKLKKRLSRIFAPNNNLKAWKIMHRQEVPEGIIYEVYHASGHTMRIGCFPVDKVGALDGSVRANQQFADGLYYESDNGNTFSLTKHDCANITVVRPEGHDKGHVIICPHSVHLPYNVDLELIDPKSDIATQLDHEFIYIGVNCKCHASSVALDIESAINFFGKAPEAIARYAKEALFSISRMIPLGKNKEELISFVEEMRKHDPILDKVRQWTESVGFEVPMPHSISSSINIIKDAISYVLGDSSGKNPRIPLGGDSRVLCLKPCIYHDSNVFERLHEQYGKDKVIVVVPHVLAITEAIVWRVPNNRGEFVEVLFVPSSSVDEYKDMPTQSPIGYVGHHDLENIIFPICGGADGDDHFQSICASTHADLMSVFVRTPRSINNLDIIGKPCLVDADNVTKSMVDYIKVIRGMSWNIGVLTNAVLVSQLTLDAMETEPHYRNMVSVEQRKIMEDIVHLPLSDALDAEKAGMVIDEGGDPIAIILDKFWSNKNNAVLKHVPLFFMSNAMKYVNHKDPDEDRKSKWISNVVTKRLRNRVISYDKSTKLRRYEIYDQFSIAFVNLGVIGHAIINKLDTLSWRCRAWASNTIVHSSILDKPSHATYNIEVGLTPDNGLNGNFSARLKSRDDEIMAMDKCIGVWRGMVSYLRSGYSRKLDTESEHHHNKFNDLKNRAMMYSDAAKTTKRRNAMYDRIHAKLVEHAEIYPRYRDILVDIIIPGIGAVREAWGLSERFSDMDVLKIMIKESLIIQYKTRDPRYSVAITNESKYLTGIPSAKLDDLTPGERYDIYCHNTIIKYNDTITGYLIRSLVALKNCNGSIENLCDAANHKDSSIFRGLFTDTPPKSLAEIIFNNQISKEG